LGELEAKTTVNVYRNKICLYQIK